MCHLSLTPRTYWEVISDRQRTGPRESHPSEDLSELPPLRDPATRWFPNVMDYSDLKQGCGWTGVPLCPFPVMAAPGAARFLQAAVTRSYRTGLYARPIMIIRWDLLIMSVYHGAAPESALALRAGKGGCYWWMSMRLSRYRWKKNTRKNAFHLSSWNRRGVNPVPQNIF